MGSSGIKPPVLPCLQSEKYIKSTGSTSGNDIDSRHILKTGHDVSFCKDMDFIQKRMKSDGCFRNNSSVASLLRGFFIFYAWKFKWTSKIMSIRKGKPDSKDIHISNPAQWRYALEDPFEVDRDLGCVIISRPAMYRTIEEFRRGASILLHCDCPSEQHSSIDQKAFTTSVIDYLCGSTNEGGSVCMRCGMHDHVAVECFSLRRKKLSALSEATDTDEGIDSGSTVMNTDIFTSLCYRCGGNHPVKQCPSNQGCFICKKKGHEAVNCPNKKKKKKHQQSHSKNVKIVKGDRNENQTTRTIEVKQRNGRKAAKKHKEQKKSKKKGKKATRKMRGKKKN